MHTCLNFSDPEIVTFASDHLTAWLDRAKRVYVNVWRKDSPLVEFFDDLIERMKGIQ
jgi:hypothetical protein